MELGIYKCANCSKVYKNISSLKKHIIADHTQKSESVLVVSNIKSKKPKIGRPKLNKCITCNKAYSSKYTLERHVNTNTCNKQTYTTTVDNSVPWGADLSYTPLPLRKSKFRTPLGCTSNWDLSVLQSLTGVLLKLADSKQVNYTNSGVVFNGCSNVIMADHIGNTENTYRGVPIYRTPHFHYESPNSVHL
jgi:DNA-directed RNA polymerase subunit RPC12/RpoP